MTPKKLTPFPVLHTQRLTLRPLRGSDDQEVWALRSNEYVNRYLDRRPCTSLENARHFIHAITESVQREECLYWAITVREADHVIGTVCLYNWSADATKAELGYELLPDFQGKGYVHEALSTVLHFGFQQAGLHAIEAYTHPENYRSTSVLEKLQFQKDRTADENITLFRLTRAGGR